MAKSKNNPMCKVGDTLTMDIETGETIPIEGGGIYMLPGPKGSCEWCHVTHDPKEPHNKDSLSYQIKFNAIKGRSPTWTDAMAHCSEEVKLIWRRLLVEIMNKNGVEVPADLL